MWLDDQEPDNQRTEDDQFRMRDAGRGNFNTEHTAQQRQKLVEEDRQHHNERRAKEAAHDGAHATNDDHEQQLERQVHGEGGRLPGAQVNKSPQGTRHTNDEGTDGKRRQLGVHRPDADHGRRDVHVTNGHPLTANGRAHQVLGGQGNDHQNRQTKQVLGNRTGDRLPEHLQARDRHRARGRVVGQPLDAQKHPVAEELRRQCGHRQVQTFDAQARQAEKNAKHRGTNSPQQ